MARVEKVTFTNMCMISDDAGRVLVQDRLDKQWPGITFPGGHVEVGESFTDSVIREVREETGLAVSNLQMCGIKDWTNDDGTRYVVLCYKTNSFVGNLESSDEGQVFWTSLDELSKLKLADGMEDMLKIFLEDVVSEQFFYKRDGEWIDELK